MLFPGGRLPLRIFEQRYVEMLKTCLRDSAPFGVCAIREGKEVERVVGATSKESITRMVEKYVTVKA